jgi:hypothetical protein
VDSKTSAPVQRNASQTTDPVAMVGNAESALFAIDVATLPAKGVALPYLQGYVKISKK